MTLMIIIKLQATLKRYVRSSCLLFSAIKGEEATHPNVPINPAMRLARRRIEGCKATIWTRLMKLDA